MFFFISGEPDEIINRFQEEYIVRRGTFSFLPAHRQPGKISHQELNFCKRFYLHFGNPANVN